MKRRFLQQHMEGSWMQHQLMICDAFKEIKRENEILKTENKLLKEDNEEMKRAQQTADYWINGYKLMAEGVRKTNWREYLNSLAVVSTNIPETVCPVIIKWTEYAELKSKAKEGGHSFYYTRSFYTHLGGYKMRLQVYPNGMDSGKNTHMSVYCQLMPGKNNDQLTWPFKGTVVVSLLNQIEDKEHINKEVWSSHHVVPDEVAKKPVCTRNNEGWGYAQFLQFSVIEDFAGDKQYLMNDTLIFKICVNV